jgi:regulator of extracellular matrix RemA (YlzA/DUF370 family)
MMPYEHTGLGKISSFGDDEMRACGFANVLIVQLGPTISSPSSTPMKKIKDGEGYDFHVQPMVTTCFIQPHGVAIEIEYEGNIVSAIQTQRVADQLRHTIKQVVEAGATQRISDVDVCSPEDKAAIKARNDLQVVTNTMQGMQDDELTSWLETQIASASDRKLSNQALRRVGLQAYIVDKLDRNTLAPIGAVGQLILESSTTKITGADDAANINTTFIVDPAWASRVDSSSKPII